MLILERFCDDPPPPPTDAESDWDEAAFNVTGTPFQTEVRYSCLQGRQFRNQTEQGNLYDAHVKKCLWSREWEPNEQVGCW